MEAETSEDDLKVALSLDNLAEVYFEQSKYDKAEPLYQRSLRIRERMLEPEHEDIVASLNNLGPVFLPGKARRSRAAMPAAHINLRKDSRSRTR